MKEQLNNKNRGCGKLFKPEYFGVTCGEISLFNSKIMLCKGCEKKSKEKKDKKLAEDIKKNEKYFKVIDEKIEENFIGTKKQRNKLKELLYKHENEDVFTCKECEKRLKGMKEVREHYMKEKHYNYKFKTINGKELGVCFA